MVGWNYEVDKSQKMTTDEKEALRALGGIALLGSLGYLWLTRETPIVTKGLNIYEAGAFQERGEGFTLQRYNISESGTQTLPGFAVMQEIELFAVHNGKDPLKAVIEAEFTDGSKKSVTKAESKRSSTQYGDSESASEEFGKGAVTSSINIEPTIDFEKELMDNGKSISKYRVTLNVSDTGLTKAIAYIVGA